MSDAPPVVLVVDDCPVNRALVGTSLRREGYRIVEAGDGLAGLAAIQRERPALAIVDLMMPGVDGAEMIRRLRREEGAELPAILLLTALGEEDASRRAQELDAQGWMTKPFLPSVLRAKVRALLARA